MSRLKGIAEFAIDTVYPKRCAGCGRRGSWLCVDCDRGMARFAPPWCDRCGVPNALSHCGCVSPTGNSIDVRSVGPFAGWLRSAILALKYQGEWGRVEHLGPMLVTTATSLGPADMMVPVPLHATRLRERGFNQSQLLAEWMGRELDQPVVPLLFRRRATRSQARLSAPERGPNVADAFGVVEPGSERFIGATIMLVDDVITTGATLRACADALLASGANRVCAATLAREL